MIIFKDLCIHEEDKIFPPKACEKFHEIARKSQKYSINIAELKTGKTAPPFHPNCGCAMIPGSSAEKDGNLRETAWIVANSAFEFLATLQQPWMKFLPFYEEVKSTIWMVGTLFLYSKGWLIAKELFSWGMYGNGKELPQRVKNMLIEEMKHSNILREKIKEYTKNGVDFNSGKTSIEFKPHEANLHYSVQNAYLWLEGKN